MLWSLFLLPVVIATELITLTPSSKPESSLHEEESKLFIGDSLICNDKECYPKVFEAKEYWQEVRPSQLLPAGLDIRMNLETGSKEAKNGESNQSSEVPSEYEFSRDFNKIRTLLNLKKITDKDYSDIESILDDLVEYSHDYKHGYKILTHEFKLLQQLAFDHTMPMSTREISSRILASCLRNNPPVIDFVNANYPSFIQELQSQMSLFPRKLPSQHEKTLIKRYLSIMQALLTRTSVDLDEDGLLELYHIDDKQIRVRVLEIVSRLYHNDVPIDPELHKRSLESKNVQKWFNEFATLIQDNEIDELHLREFFHSMYNIKEKLGKSVKVDPTFLNWLSLQSENRQQSLRNKRQERDLEKDEFDEKLIESRHLVFGNPMAYRVKHFDDEL